MEHDHQHDHTHGANKKTLLISFIIVAFYMVVEAAGGFITNSLALLSDAGHMLSDAISLGVALLAFTLGGKAADFSKTYGYRRFEILAAVLNGIALLLIAAYIFYEAVRRLQNPPEIASSGMLIIASIGLLVNILVAWIMARGGDVEDNLNMRGAYLHVISDMVGSLGAMTAALLIMFMGWGWADPLASLIVAVLILRSGYHVTAAGLHVLMEGTPHNVDIDGVVKTILNTKEIQSVHDLHVWSITSGLNALSCHAVVSDQLPIMETECLLQQIEHDLKHLNIHHMTIQFETSAHLHGDAILCDIRSGSPEGDH